MDEKVELIEAEFGVAGFGVVVKLFQEIYGKQGYYIEFTQEVALLFSKKNNLGYNVVSEIVEASTRRGIFDKQLYEKYSILTSAGIQKRYFEAIRKRKNITVINEYILVDFKEVGVNSDINSINAVINSINSDKSTQSKVKESKEKKSKVLEYDKTLFCEKLNLKIGEWMQYKSERKETYQQTGFTSLITQIKNKVNEYGEQAVIEVIDLSMANNWKGIIWDRINKKSERQKNVSYDLEAFKKQLSTQAPIYKKEVKP